MNSKSGSTFFQLVIRGDCGAVRIVIPCHACQRVQRELASRTDLVYCAPPARHGQVRRDRTKSVETGATLRARPIQARTSNEHRLRRSNHTPSMSAHVRVDRSDAAKLNSGRRSKRSETVDRQSRCRRRHYNSDELPALICGAQGACFKTQVIR